VISTGDCVSICDISAVVPVILQLAANSELRQKVLDLVLKKIGSLGLGLDTQSLGLGLEKKSWLHHWL